MKRASLSVFFAGLTFLCLPALCLPARAEELVSGISQDIIEITSNYTGTEIVVFGAIERSERAQGRSIVVVVRGPDTPMAVRRRDRFAGVWVNRDSAKFEGLPSYYYLASTEPVTRIAAAPVLIRHGVGISYLSPSAIGTHHDYRPFLDAAGRHMKQLGLYKEAPGTIDFLSESLFRTRVPVPASVTRGQYNVEVYLFRDGEVVSAQSTPLFIDQTGIERRLFNLAHNAPLAYGLICVFMAILLGWISSVLFRRPA